MSPALARETVVNGKIGTGLDYTERDYDNDSAADSNDEGDKQQFGIYPAVTITSKSPRDTLSFNYAPVLKYDDISSETEVDHFLSLAGERFINQKWSVSLSDNFRFTDDFDPSTTGLATEASAVEDDQDSPEIDTDELTRDEGRNRYWTNSFSASTNYAYAEDSNVTGGYTYAVLRNDSDNNSLDEYDKHALFARIGHAFSQSWRSLFGVDYTRGQFDEETGSGTSSDLDQYGTDLGVTYKHSPQTSFPFSYRLSITDYDSSTRRDNYTHDFLIGWEHAFDSRTTIGVGGGPTYVDADGLDGEWDYNVYLNFSRSYEHGAFALQLEKTYDTQNFSGSDNSGLKDTFGATVTYSHQHTKNLYFDLMGRYRYESNVDPQGDLLMGAGSEEDELSDITYDKDIYEAGVGLRYTFLRHYTAGLRYAYYVSDGERNNDQYSDHRVMLTVSANADLWRW